MQPESHAASTRKGTAGRATIALSSMKTMVQHSLVEEAPETWNAEEVVEVLKILDRVMNGFAGIRNGTDAGETASIVDLRSISLGSAP